MNIHFKILCIKFLPILIMVNVVFFNTGCISKKAIGDMNYLPNDPNHRLQVENARYKEQLSPLSISVISLSTISGAYIGYNSNLVGYYGENERKTDKIANAAIGAVTGFGISYLTNLAIKGKKTSIQLKNELDASKWVRKNQGNGYKIIEFDSRFDDFRIIHQDYESHFIFRDQQDFADFSNVFGNYSPFFSQNIHESLNFLGRGDLIWLYKGKSKNHLTNDVINDLENEILEKSKKISDLGETAILIPRFEKTARERAWEQANSIMNLATFSTWFNEWHDKAEAKALELVVSLQEAKDFKRYFFNDAALVKKVQSVLGEDDIYLFADLYEVSCENLNPGLTKKVNYYIPPNSFAVITLKNAPVDEVSLNFNGISNFNTENIELIQGSLSLYYAIKKTSSFSSGKLISIETKNSSAKQLRFCVHYVENDLGKRLVDAGIQLGIDKLNENLFGGKYEFQLDVIGSAVSAIQEGKNPIKRIIIEQGIEYFTSKLNLSLTESLAKDIFVRYLEDTFKNIP